MALLSRVAGRIFWSARFMERAEDTARVVIAFGDVYMEMSTIEHAGGSLWAPLAAFGGGTPSELPTDEAGVVRLLVVDRARAGSVAASIDQARDNLRTTREVLPREAWRAVNNLWIFVDREVDRATERRFRHRILERVIDDSRRLDGILMSTMTRDAAYDIWRLGRLIERADMTTRVVGLRAASLMAGGRRGHPEVHWMGVLRSLSALQMYQRATRGPIEAREVVRFLLFHETFPRSVLGALSEIENSLDRLSRSDGARTAVSDVRAVLRTLSPVVDDGRHLDRAMDQVQFALAGLSDEIVRRFLRVGSGDA